MGLFGTEKGRYDDIPDEQLNYLQLNAKKWQSNAPYKCLSGWSYGTGSKRNISGALDRTFGDIVTLDDLWEMRSPRLFNAITTINLIDVVSLNNAITTINKIDMAKMNKLQKIQGQYEQLQEQFRELKKRCISQKNLLEQTMEQNKELLEQNKELMEQNRQLLSLVPSKETARQGFAR